MTDYQFEIVDKIIDDFLGDTPDDVFNQYHLDKGNLHALIARVWEVTISKIETVDVVLKPGVLRKEQDSDSPASGIERPAKL